MMVMMLTRGNNMEHSGSPYKISFGQSHQFLNKDSWLDRYSLRRTSLIALV
jgi:hypothetical protein